MLQVVLYQPEIPPNTGNIIRLCANAGAALHLIRPLGFELSAARVRRAGLDYRELAQGHEHDNFEAYLNTARPGRVFAISTRGRQRYTDTSFQEDDAILFGPETRGLPQTMLDAMPPEQILRLPMRPDNRSLNLSNAVAVTLYEAWRQLGFDGGS
jgi:tRNA (cytidine/uridine-2'-O-)-methyltransferase